MAATLSDVQVDAVKIGMLGNAEVIECVAEALAKYKPSKVVLDPVMVAKSGDRLLDGDSVAALRDVLLPQVGSLTRDPSRPDD